LRDKMDARLERIEAKFDAKLDSLKTEIERGDTESIKTTSPPLTKTILSTDRPR